jgi:hypothetical protein
VGRGKRQNRETGKNRPRENTKKKLSVLPVTEPREGTRNLYSDKDGILLTDRVRP